MRAGRAVGVVAALTLFLSATAAGAARDGEAARPAPAEKVLVLSIPTLAWSAVADDRLPALGRVLDRAAVASLSVRTIGTSTTPGEAYASIGAGNRAGVDDAVAGDVVAVEPGGASGLARFEDECGCSLDGWSLLHLGVPEIRATNERLLYGAEVGALGAALAGGGRRTAVVAQGKGEAVLALMDGLGRVSGGAVATGTDVGATAETFTDAWGEADMVLVEAGDLAGLERRPGPAGSHEDRSAAFARVDRLIAAVLAPVDLDRHLVVVVAPTSAPAEPAELTVAAVAGPGIAPGLAASASTRRAGYVTLPDVAPTVLEALGLDPPATMTGTKVVLAAEVGPISGAERAAVLARANEVATFRDRAVGPVSVAFVVVQLLAYGLALLAVRRRPGLRGQAAFLALITLALPPLAFLSGLVPYASLGLVGYVVVLLAGAASLAGLALAVAAATAGRTGRARPLVAPLVLAALTLAVLLVDVVTGGRLQLNTVFGYSPTVAGRFAGYGNLAFALVAASAVVVVTGGWATATLLQGRPGPVRRRWWLVAAGGLLALVVVADGHPALGSDVGGVLALVPGAVVVVAMLAGWRITPRLVGGIAVATVAVLGAFVAVDLGRPAEARTHLGRTAAAAFDDGALVAILERKARANLEILTSSPWVLLVPVILVGCALLVFGPGAGAAQRLDRRVPGLRAGLVGALVLGVAGGAFNDSGAAVPAMMMGVVLPYVTVLAISR